MSVRFTQSCPTCGRRVEIRANLIGRTVACRHCRAEFVADSGFEGVVAPPSIENEDSSDDLMARVDELLQMSEDPTAVS